MALAGRDAALVALGTELRASGYHFTTVTPLTHRRVIARPMSGPARLEDAFGWSRPFRTTDLPARMVGLIEEAGALDHAGALVRSRVRFSSLGGGLYVHSAFPTAEGDAVFFGPDTYRFARAIRETVAGRAFASPVRIVDVGCGSGVGALFAASLMPAGAACDIVMGDINELALRYSRVNAALNGFPEATACHSDVLGGVDGSADLIMSNPPYLVDPGKRLYRHGGGDFGFDLSLRIVREGVGRLNGGGVLLLYTGTPIVDGRDLFFQALAPVLDSGDYSFSYEELDPDVFGEELDAPPYDRADRIAAVALRVDRAKRSRE